MKIWACSLACYTKKFQAAGADVDGNYVAFQFLPFEDKGSNQELDNYLASVATPDSFGAQAWMAAVLFQQAVDEIVETDGPNAITRAKLLEVLNGIDSFDANGWMGAKDPKSGFSDCMVVMQAQSGAFERVLPTETGQVRLQSLPTSSRTPSTPWPSPRRSSSRPLWRCRRAPRVRCAAAAPCGRGTSASGVGSRGCPTINGVWRLSARPSASPPVEFGRT